MLARTVFAAFVALMFIVAQATADNDAPRSSAVQIAAKTL